MSLRMLALALAGLLAVPAALVLLRPSRGGDESGPSAPPRRLDALWALVPIVLLVALIALSAAA